MAGKVSNQGHQAAPDVPTQESNNRVAGDTGTKGRGNDTAQNTEQNRHHGSEVAKSESEVPDNLLENIIYTDRVKQQISSNYQAIRGREQMLIDHYGGPQSTGGTSGNTINGIGANNKNRDTYISERRTWGR